MNDIAEIMFGDSTPDAPATRGNNSGGDPLANRLFGSSEPAAPQRNGPRFVLDGRGAYIDPRSGARAPAPQSEQSDPMAAENQRAVRQYGASHDAQGNALDPLESIGAQTPDHILRDRADRDPEGAGKLFAGETDTGETRLAIDKAIDTITPDVPATLRQAVTAEYAAIAGDIGLEPSEVSEIAQAAQGAFANGAPDIDQRSAWRYTSRNIAAGYGSRQSAVVAEAQRMIAGDPRVKTMLARTGLGDHPAVVRNVLAAADRRLRGSK